MNRLLFPIPVCVSAIAVAGCFSSPPDVDDGDSTDSTGTSAPTTSPATTGTTEVSGSTVDPSGATTTGSETTSPGTSDSDSSTGLGQESGSTETGPSSSSGGAMCPTYADSFDNAELDAGWIQTQPESISVSDEGLNLIATVQTGDFVSVRRDGLDLNTATVTFELGTAPTSDSTQLLLNAFNPNNARILMIVQNDTIVMRRSDGTEPLYEIASTPLDPVAHQWLRFDIQAPTVLLQASADGNEWTTLHTETIDYDYAASSVGASVSNFAALKQPETVTLASFELCLE